MKQFKKLVLSLILVSTLAVSLIVPVYANAAIKLNATSKTMYKGDSFTLKLTGTTKKPKWTSSNKAIVSVTTKGKVTAKKEGKATITAKLSNKKYNCKITVKIKDGDRTKPLSAYQPFTFKCYEYDEYLGKFKIQLLESMEGKEAYDYLTQDDNYQPELKANEQYVYYKFKIKYIDGKKEVRASDVINYHSNFYNSNATKQISSRDWAFIDDGIEDMVNISLYPGAEVTGYFTLIVNEKDTPLTYRLETGYNKSEYQQEYTWFTTKQ